MVTSFDIAHLAVAAKSHHERLAQQVCHPEPFGYAQDKLREGSRGQILRCAQNDTSERLRRRVYQCHAFRFSSLSGINFRVRRVTTSVVPAARRATKVATTTGKCFVPTR